MIKSFFRPKETWAKDINEQIEGVAKHKFTYSLFFHTGDWKKGLLYKVSREQKSKPLIIQDFPYFQERTLPDYLSFLKVEPENLIITGLLSGKWKDYFKTL